MTQPQQPTSPALGIGVQPENHMNIDDHPERHQASENLITLAQNPQGQSSNSLSQNHAQHVLRQAHTQISLQSDSEEPVDGQQASSSAVHERTQTPLRRGAPTQGSGYEVPNDREDGHALTAVPPIYAESGDQSGLQHPHRTDTPWPAAEDGTAQQGDGTPAIEDRKPRFSSAATQLYTLSYLVFFSILGTLARIGLTALTTFPGSPVIFATIWANVGGSLIMGFLTEDSKIFRQEWGNMSPHRREEYKGNGYTADESALRAAKKAHLSVKKTIPLYIGLATGFCGSMTSFSTFARDAFLALSNNMTVPGAPGLPTSRNGGYSFMAMLAVIITTVALSLCGLVAGYHFAVAIEPYTPTLPLRATRRYLDPLFVFLGWGSWLGAVLLSIFPPRDYWRQRATFALVFAPLGCLLRYYLSMFLNGKSPKFPLGTFSANILGTAVLGMCWDIAHERIGGLVGCQVLQGVEDGFCGCLTTISTWVAELSTLRRKHSYLYGSVSVVTALVLLIAIMGGLRWSHGFDALVCS